MAIPATGFFRIYPISASIVGGNFALSNAPTVITTATPIGNYFKAGVDNPVIAPCAWDGHEVPPASGVFVPFASTYELQFSPNTGAIVFDPAGANETIDFLSSDFPMGCLMNQLFLHWNGQIVAGPSRDIFVANLKQKFFGSTIKTTVPAPNVTFTGDIDTDPNAIVSSLINWSPIQVFKQFGFSFDISATISVLLLHPQVRSDLFYLQGVYNTALFNITSTPNAGPGDFVQITDANSRLDLFDNFYVYWDTLEGEEDVNSLIPGFTGRILIPWFIRRTASVIEFYLPSDQLLPYGGRRLMIAGAGDGVSFVGDFPIANINVLLADGSGMYQLTEGKRSDTYYDRSALPTVSEIDLKIPDPRFRTGYF